ncbi:pilus assembly protein [Massilia glaciei]|uniref:Pilus assembly protein n=1 Tax=Massilia glaciei TaxID=1524097 RepID=A0A2U2I6D3_9BURK|nr:pilus assembly protein [Massilia glaciei]PWF55189.1 pilus assembly protein [Massilia glaciei]
MNTCKHARITSALALALAAALSGCAAPAQVGFGDTVRAALGSQVIAPDAARNQDPVSGIDGRAARAASDNYERSFTTPQPAAAGSLLSGSAK